VLIAALTPNSPIMLPAPVFTSCCGGATTGVTGAGAGGVTTGVTGAGAGGVGAGATVMEAWQVEGATVWLVLELLVAFTFVFIEFWL
jgi:hypothetical protein